MISKRLYQPPTGKFHPQILAKTLEIFRFLYTEERLRCHGFPHNADYGLSVAESIKASGNAYSVNTVGRIFAPFLKALIDTDALTEVPLIKPAGSAKGETNLGAWLEKKPPRPMDRDEQG